MNEQMQGNETTEVIDEEATPDQEQDQEQVPRRSPASTWRNCAARTPSGVPAPRSRTT